jgi:hypothetical protein
MTRHWLFVLVCLLVLFGSVGCSSSKNLDPTVLALAESDFASISPPSADAQSVWGLTDLRVFGRDSRFGVMGAGSPSISPSPDSPDTFAVSIPYWCAGKTPAGDSVRRQGAVVMFVQNVPGKSAPVVLRREFRNQEPLSFWRELGAYFGWLFVFVLVVSIPAGILSAMMGGNKSPLMFASSLGVLAAGYVASVVFGSTLAIVVCVTLAIIGVILQGIGFSMQK